MLFLIGVETATLTMLEASVMASASEELMDALAADVELEGVVTGFREEDRTLGASFFLEADNAGSAAESGYSHFLRGVVRTVTACATSPLPVGTRVEARDSLEGDPAPTIARVEVEAKAAA